MEYWIVYYTGISLPLDQGIAVEQHSSDRLGICYKMPFPNAFLQSKRIGLQTLSYSMDDGDMLALELALIPRISAILHG